MSGDSLPIRLSNSGSLDELYGLLKGLSICAGWSKPTPSLWNEPRKTFVPSHWRYATAKAALDAAGRLINTNLAERRNLILHNPVEGNSYATTRTLMSAYQMLLPGEKARSHRHTPNALRLILDAGDGAYTIVDGTRIPMAPGDVLLTPNWCWHGHGNDSHAPAYWLDFLDTPLIHALETMFTEWHPSGYEPVVQTLAASPMRFAWADTEHLLEEAAPDPSGPLGTAVNLGNPAMATIALQMMRLEAGVPTALHRTTANCMYAVAKGAGETHVDGERFTWVRGDVVAAPAWRAHHHRAWTDAVLLRVSDEAMLEKLDLLRMERLSD